MPDAPRKKRRTRRTLVLALLACLLAAGTVQVIRVLRRPPEVLVVAAKTEDVSRMLALTGRVEAAQTVLLSPRFSGRITEIVHHEGDRVSRGEILARLADTVARSDVRQQEAVLSSREHDLAQAQRDLARTSLLVSRGAVASAELESARLLVARATDDVRRLGEVLRESRAQLVLLAPFDGTIIRRDGEVGQTVGPQSTVFELASAEAARVSAEVDERYVRALRVGMRAEILPVGSEDARRTATVSYVAHAVDPQTGAATVRFVYDNAPTSVLFGMSVDVNVNIETIAAAVTIPREAVGGGGARPFVLVVTNGKVARREVTVDDWPAPLVVVRSGLARGEQVLLDPTGAAVGASVRTKLMAHAL
ncbi:MAG: efflux RND transporter periplasmic adaptor subunit [Sandaracinaceae bacterium]|nr:efflux RND transporter periplasmic adaptor subunit [Sandaracinaceae bacterium]